MKLIYTIFLITTISISCTTSNSTANTNTDSKPAFEGQTRVAGVKTTSPYTTEVITEELNKPWGIAELPDGRLLITEKEGVMRIVNTESGEVSEAITGIPAVDSRAQGGLL